MGAQGLYRISSVVKRSHFFDAWEQATGRDLGSIKVVNFDALSDVRNKLTHNGYEASKFDAEFLFQVLQGFIDTFDILTIDASAQDGVQEGWLLGEVELSKVERESKHTWVFSHDLSNDVNQSADGCVIEGHLFQAVRTNLLAGNRYTYFVPDTQHICWAIREYHKLHTFDDQQVSFVKVPDIAFSMISEAVVYNVGETGEMAVEWLPNGKANFYVKMDTTHMRRVLAYGYAILEHA